MLNVSDNKFFIMAGFFKKALEFLTEVIAIPFIPFLLLIGLLLPKKAKSIVILGTKRAGKTTLWEGLGGIETIRANTSVEPIQSFEITRSDGTKVTISETYDIGGEDDFVGEYGRIIKDGTFIYYLVDSNEIRSSATMARIRSDLVKFDKVAKEKSIKNLGFRFILTHYYDYTKNNPGKSEYDLYRAFLKGLEKSKGRGIIGDRLEKAEDYYDIMMVAELDKKKARKIGTNYIDYIKNEIGG